MHIWEVAVHDISYSGGSEAVAEGAEDGLGVVTAEHEDEFVSRFEAAGDTGGEAGFALVAEAVDENAGVAIGALGAELAEDGLDFAAAADEFEITGDGDLLAFGIEKGFEALPRPR